MTDQELVRRVAVVCGIELCDHIECATTLHIAGTTTKFWPLTDKAQASDVQDVLEMDVICQTHRGEWKAQTDDRNIARDSDKLRAICLCAAQIYKDNGK